MKYGSTEIPKLQKPEIQKFSKNLPNFSQIPGDQAQNFGISVLHKSRNFWRNFGNYFLQNMEIQKLKSNLWKTFPLQFHTIPS